MNPPAGISLKIAICGSRGIPNNYGGFEQCAEQLSVLLAEKGHAVTVYNPHYHPYRDDIYKGVRIIRQYHPEKRIGTAANFIYDYLCMRHALREKCDIMLVLGYTTASIFNPILRKRQSIMVTNMDGLEWKRDKWSKPVKMLIRSLEALGARYGGQLVSDNREIKNYLLRTYEKDSAFIPYGATIPSEPDHDIPGKYGVRPDHFDLLIARLEKENNIEPILDGIVLSGSKTPILVVGNHNTPYGEYLKNRYRQASDVIRFTGGIYRAEELDSLRGLSRFYFHGHSVGGTNPSLLEAMAASALIIAHDNPFNRDVLGNDGFYFKNALNISELLSNAEAIQSNRTAFTHQQKEKIRNEFSWSRIADQYEALFLELKRQASIAAQ